MKLKLNPCDPKVIAACDAEKRLREAYHVTGKDHHIYIESLDIQVRVCEYGEGEPLLIVPGNTGDSFVFMPLIAQLTGYKILALNRPGGGLSEGFDHHTVEFNSLAVKTLDAVYDYFKFDTVSIVAHSMGGHWSLWYAMDRPQRVKKLILLGAPGNVMKCKPPFALRVTSIPKLNHFLFSLVSPKDVSPALRGLKLMGHSRKTIESLPDSMSECYFYFQKLPHYEMSSLSMMEVTNTLLGSKANVHISQNELRKIHQPVQMIWGENDTFGTAEKGLEIAHSMPNANFYKITNGGHLPWLDAPQQCGELIVKFLSK